jgi:isocitrate dehydrogenase
MQTPGVAEGLKLISRKGCEKVVRLAFELARAEGREIVHCATKSNIMKLTEGMMKRTFEDVAKEYPDIESTHIIVDNCAHQLVKRPEQFDIIVTTNMNGDILSDLASALIGGLGYAPSANIGNEVAIFEAVHGTAPKYAGKNVINPTAVIMSSVMMLRYIGEFEAASSIEHAVLLNLEEGKYLTRDIVGDERNASTTEYTDAIIDKLGRKAQQWQVRDYKPIQVAEVSQDPDLVKATHRKSVGLDLFIESGLDAEKVGRSVESLTAGSALELKMISNRGTKVYPASGAMTDCVDHWRCRFIIDASDGEMTDAHVIDLLTRIEGHYRWIHLEKLEEIDGQLGFTRAQGED